MAYVEAAPVGTVFDSLALAGGGGTGGPDDDLAVTYTIGAKCERNDGRWFCMTHDRGFRNNFEKDGHIMQGKHVMTWLCFDHGPEVP